MKILESYSKNTSLKINIDSEFQIGELYLSSGRIVACDPVSYWDHDPLVNYLVEPGLYPVIISISNDRCAFLTLVFSESQIVKWIPATWYPEDLDKTTTLENSLSYVSESGIGGFLDFDTAKIYEEESFKFINYYEEVLKAEFGSSNYLNYYPLKGDKHNLIMCVAGSAAYQSFWGVDSQDMPVCLLTEFKV